MKSLMRNPIYISDLEKTSHFVKNLARLEEKTFIITGATGLICSAVIDLLLFCSKYYDLDVMIYAAGRSRESVENRFDLTDRHIDFVQYNAVQDITFNINTDYIIHGAGNASPELFTTFPVDTMLSNVLGMNSLLTYAKDQNVKRVLYISSSEVYGQSNNSRPFQEEDYGFVDILNVRSSYPISKQTAETLCSAYLRQYHIDSVIVRPGHIYGPTALSSDMRLSSFLVREAVKGNDLILKSEGTQIRSYCYCLDCASAILTVLLNGQSGHAYNISNKASVISIRRMAEIIARIANVDIAFCSPTDDEKSAFNPMHNSSLSSDKLESLGWKGVFDAVEGFEHTVKICMQ